MELKKIYLSVLLTENVEFNVAFNTKLKKRNSPATLQTPLFLSQTPQPSCLSSDCCWRCATWRPAVVLQELGSGRPLAVSWLADGGHRPLQCAPANPLPAEEERTWMRAIRERREGTWWTDGDDVDVVPSSSQEEDGTSTCTQEEEVEDGELLFCRLWLLCYRSSRWLSNPR